MKVIRAFRNLDRHGQQRAPEVIEEEVRQLELHGEAAILSHAESSPDHPGGRIE
ncbi:MULTISPECIES: hypothetical protein [Alphaproteobacteria]|jgi:hypothetical protein|uniref:Uncharacterized protein n=1 Tax=Agrobacterium genomosp. 2 str. CFBP 5494 TaxID=1183436 RepID=A0A9W5B6Q9_9HYPH|nr:MULTISPECIES: hypothetical protein [Alphaproteobacteria]MDH2197249.1 hypothetical protein [Agrobacterium pusense]WCK27512.1 hypothetical protein CFBP5496_0025840 [Agrobacterium pusense]CUX01529.1 hypothetical protein AGR2A_pa10049 [Agrobacterium genomosp. 2 str. CFBP 5494]